MSRFLLLTHIYPPAVDGGSKIISKIGKYLEKDGHETLVVTSNCSLTDDFVSTRQSRILTKEDSQNIIRIPVITFLHRPFKLLGRIFPLFKTLSKGPIFKYLPLLKIILYKPDYIIAGPLPTTIVFYARIIQILTKSKLIICPCFHPSDPDFRTPAISSILNKSNYLWCLSHYEKKYLFTKLQITKPQYFVYGLGVDSNFIIDPKKIKYPKKPHLIFIANFAAHKRAELLIQAFELILKKHPETRLSLLGQKTLYFPKLIQFINKAPKNVQKKIKIIIKPSKKQIISHLDNSSFLILPSIQESFGLVFIESLARGKAVIGASTPQTRETINKLKGGLLFKTDCVDDLSKKICQLIESPKLSQKLALDGYQNVKKFYTWNRIGKELCKKLFT